MGEGAQGRAKARERDAVMVLGSASLEVTTSRVYRSGTGASVRSVIVVFWPCGIALVSGRGSNRCRWGRLRGGGVVR
jgi:hypothetical protein